MVKNGSVYFIFAIIIWSFGFWCCYSSISLLRKAAPNCLHACGVEWLMFYGVCAIRERQCSPSVLSITAGWVWFHFVSHWPLRCLQDNVSAARFPPLLFPQCSGQIMCLHLSCSWLPYPSKPPWVEWDLSAWINFCWHLYVTHLLHTLYTPPHFP